MSCPCKHWKQGLIVHSNEPCVYCEAENLRAENAELKEKIDQDEGLLKSAREHAAFVADENATLREALKSHAEEAAKLQSQFDAMCALTEIRDQREECEKRLGVAEEAEKLVKAAWVDRKYKGLVGWHVSLLPPDGTQLYMIAAAPKPEK